jgi:hypothetical protein
MFSSISLNMILQGIDTVRRRVVSDGSESSETSNWWFLFRTGFLIWLPIGVFGAAIKFWFLAGHAYRTLPVALGTVEQRFSFFDVNSLSAGQQLSFFRGDLIYAILLAPLCFAIAGRLMPRRWFYRLAGAFIVAAFLIESLAFIELAVVSRVAPLGLLTEGLSWGIAHPGAALTFVFQYSFFTRVRRPLYLLGFTVALCLIVLLRRFAKGWNLKAIALRIAPALWAACATVALPAWFPWMRATAYHSALVQTALLSSFESRSSSGAYSGLELPALRPRYARLVNAPDATAPRPHWGEAKGYDVILVIMETGPAAHLMRDPDLAEFPNLKRMAAQSWVGTRHYTTALVSYRAVSSILCSSYPPDYFGDSEHSKMLPGLVRSLKTAGYRTGVYSTAPVAEGVGGQERTFYGALGADRVFIPATQGLAYGAQEEWRAIEQLDLQALRQLETDFRSSAAEGKRFLGVYLPQLAHEPWVDVRGSGTERDPIRRRINLMRLEDLRLHELLQTLEESGRLDHTLVVVTFDHGIRSPQADPSFREGQVDDLAVHVPFFLYAPGIVKERTDLPWVTSHIDIEPSLLDLLAVSGGRDGEAGSAVWASALAHRLTFFWAYQYLGADAYYDGAGRFRMSQPLMNLTYAGPELGFTKAQMLPAEGPGESNVSGTLDRMSALRNAWYAADLRYAEGVIH